MPDIVWLKIVEFRDIEFLQTIRNANKDYFFNSKPVTFEDTKNWVFKCKDNYAVEAFIIMRGNEYVGTITVNYRTGEIGNVAILPNFQGEGIGQEAMKIAIGLVDLEAKGQVTPHVNVQSNNTKAFRFYEKLGFKLTRVRMDLYE